MFEVGAHELDMLRCLMGHPQTVRAVRQKRIPYAHEIEDLTSIEISFDSGASASFEGGGGSYTNRYGFHFYFEGATLVSDVAFRPGALQAFTADGPLDLDADTFMDVSPVQRELADWLQSLRTGEPVPVPGEEGMRTVALIEAAYRSAETGDSVPFSL
jgi:predicted dehydrogenase